MSLKMKALRNISARLWVIALVIGLGIIATGVVATFIQRLEQWNLQSHFVKAAEDDFFATEANLRYYRDIVEDTSAFYAASMHVDRREFSIFVKTLLANRPAIHSIQWIPYVTAAQRPVYETAAREENLLPLDLSNFSFTEQQGETLVTAGTRAEYYPVYYQEPMHNPDRPLGFDLGSDPVYLQMFQAVRKQAKPMAIEYVDPMEVKMGVREEARLIFKLVSPVYTSKAPKPTMSTPSAELMGYLSAAIRVDKLIAATLKDMTTDDVYLTIYDRSTLAAPRWLYAYPPSALTPPLDATTAVEQSESPLRVEKTLDLADKQWLLVFRPTPAYLAANKEWYHWLIWGGGLLMTLGWAAYLNLVLDKNHQTRLLVQERTEQLRHTNQHLEETLARLQFQTTLLECTGETAQDGILVVSPERRWLYFNQRFIDLWEIPQTVVEGGSSLEAVQWAFAQMVNPSKNRATIEYLYDHPDAQGYDEVALTNGTILTYFSTPVRGGDDALFGRVWYYRDVTQRKQTEEALRQSEARNRALISAIPDLMFRVQKDGIFLDYHSVPDYTPVKAPEDFLGRNVSDVFPAEAAQQLKARIAAVLASGEMKITEYEMPMLTGEQRTWEQRVVMINEEEVLLIIRDITDRKVAEAALRTSQQQLQERQQSEKHLVEEELLRVRNQLVMQTRLATLGQVAATIAHELRNPLGAARNAAYYIRRYLTQNNPELTEFLQIIEVEVITADHIITDLLEMSRAKEPNLQPLNLREMVYEIWQQTKQNSKIQVDCVVSPDPFFISADATQFRQILVNLITNAVQAMPDGGTLCITGEQQHGECLIFVQDSGPGVPAELRGQIFEPLFTTKAKGTGLGLALCRQIMEKHDGTIELISSGQGATFCIRLPHK